jgi:hypothetical protein
MLQYLFHKFCLIETESRDGSGYNFFIIFKGGYRAVHNTSAAKKKLMAAAGFSKTNHLGVGGVDDMTLVTVQGSGVLGSGLKPFFRASELQTPEP